MCIRDSSYSVSFDDNWEEMVAKSPELGKDDGSGTIVRNDRWVSGSTANMTGLVYGESAPLPENGFKMGAYVFDGWATSPDLAEGDRMEGSNFFSPGASIATPSPAPAHEATLVLYAQWKAVDLSLIHISRVLFCIVWWAPKGLRRCSEPAFRWTSSVAWQQRAWPPSTCVESPSTACSTSWSS